MRTEQEIKQRVTELLVQAETLSNQAKKCLERQDSEQATALLEQITECTSMATALQWALNL